MKKYIRRFVSLLLMTTIVISLLPLRGKTAANVVPIEYDGEFLCYIALACNQDWTVYYYSPENYSGVTEDTVTAKVGETVTVKAVLDNPAELTRFVCPVLVAENIIALDYDISCEIDGKKVSINMNAGEPWWYQHTGDFDDYEAIRLAGGYNEFTEQYIEMPVFNEISYTINIKSAKVPASEEQLAAIEQAEEAEKEAERLEEEKRKIDQDLLMHDDFDLSYRKNDEKNYIFTEAIIVLVLSLYAGFNSCYLCNKYRRRPRRKSARKILDDIVIREID